MQIATITSKRQLTIPAKIFKKANLSIGDKVIIKEEGGELRIKRSADLVEKLAGSATVSQSLRGVDVEVALRIAKQRYFGRGNR